MNTKRRHGDWAGIIFSGCYKSLNVDVKIRHFSPACSLSRQFCFILTALLAFLFFFKERKKMVAFCALYNSKSTTYSDRPLLEPAYLWCRRGESPVPAPSCWAESGNRATHALWWRRRAEGAQSRTAWTPRSRWESARASLLNSFPTRPRRSSGNYSGTWQWSDYNSCGVDTLCLCLSPTWW